MTDEITAYFEKLNLSFIGAEATTRRYYPQNELAAAVIGFTNGDGDGQYGLEYQYDDSLSGVDGRVISAQAANGEEMPYRYSKTYDAQDGNSLYLTIDTTLQTYLESNLAEMVTKCQVNNRACGIIMNAKTGAVLAMATYPGFDLNEPYVIADPAVQEYLDTIQELRSAGLEQEYLDGVEKKLDYVVKCAFRNELAPGTAVTLAQLTVRFGLVAVLLVGGLLVAQNMLSVNMFILYLLVAGRVYEPFGSCFMLMAELFSAFVSIERT